MKSPKTLIRVIKEHFTVRVFITFTLFGVIASAAYTAFFIHQQSKSLSDALIQEGETLSGLLAYSARLGIFSESDTLLRDPVEGILQREDVLSVAVFSADGRLLKEQSKAGTNRRSTVEWGPEKQKRIMDSFARSTAPLRFESGGNIEFWAPSLSAAEPVTEESLFFGEAPAGQRKIIGLVGITIDKDILNRRLRSLLLKGILMASVFLVAGALVTYLVTRGATRPLSRLTAGVKALASGGSAEKVPVETNDEIGRLATAFNVMADSLKTRDAEKQNLEEQLRHAQKMEAIGTLSGGVAHDFNNILSAIIGYASLLKIDMEGDNRSTHYVDQILASSERAAHLTQGLLAFSRKQVLNPKAANLNEIVRRVQNLLMRVIGEDIELRTNLSDKDLTILADSGQIEQILMNLATNARDSMPDGGLLSIETARVELPEHFVNAGVNGKTGEYALLTVSDTGEGIDEEIRERIFEPFFTTKEVGKGTGLGLSIVYGIIKQHSGHVAVESTPKKGTTFKIYFPLIGSAVDELRVSAPAPVRGGTETVLVAEDEAEVRTLTKSVLEGFGYRVIEAVDGDDAIQKFLDSDGTVRLLLFDVVMPKRNGKDAYTEIRKMRPDIKVLFTSGYAADVINKKGTVEEGFNLITKPVSPKELLIRVREALDQ